MAGVIITNAENQIRDPETEPEPELAVADALPAAGGDPDVFTSFDTDMDEQLHTAEIRAVLAKMGFDADEEYVVQVIAKFDADQSGTIDRTEFAALFGVFGAEAEKQVKGRQNQIDSTPLHALMNGKAAKLFQAGDTDNSGALTSAELLVLLQSMGYAVTQARAPSPPPPPGDRLGSPSLLQSASCSGTQTLRYFGAGLQFAAREHTLHHWQICEGGPRLGL